MPMALWLWARTWVWTPPWSASLRMRQASWRVAQALVRSASRRVDRVLTRRQTRNLLDHFGIWVTGYGFDAFLEAPDLTLTAYFARSDWRSVVLE